MDDTKQAEGSAPRSTSRQDTYYRTHSSPGRGCPDCAANGCAPGECDCHELHRLDLSDTFEDCGPCGATGRSPGDPCASCGGAGQVYSGAKLAELVGVIPEAPPLEVDRAARAREERRAFAELVRAWKAGGAA